jgi:NAD(P)-dependent dehydrogenase (short-subunit alcohol dehydrogenase family)
MSDRVAAVLGVGPGLGAAVARRFAGEGFGVALMARREESVAGVREKIEGGGARRCPSQPTPQTPTLSLSPSNGCVAS